MNIMEIRFLKRYKNWIDQNLKGLGGGHGDQEGKKKR